MAAMSLDEIDNLVARLMPYGKEIGASACSGNKNTKDIITYYTLVVRCPEHMAMIACEAALDVWLKERK